MEQLKKRLSLLSAILDAFIQAPETVDYPYGPLELADGFRGAIVFDTEKCIGCGLCVRNCPAEALHFDKKSREEYRLIHYPARCAYCAQCEDDCRHGAIYHSNHLVSPTTNPEGLVVILHEKKKE
ncbi:MAG: 4Fe-4S binding protein [Chloroflexota bacterium]|nr:4Fe-4S binding protein [Chloroflexota bacterium]